MCFHQFLNLLGNESPWTTTCASSGIPKYKQSIARSGLWWAVWSTRITIPLSQLPSSVSIICWIVCSRLLAKKWNFQVQTLISETFRGLSWWFDVLFCLFLFFFFNVPKSKRKHNKLRLKGIYWCTSREQNKGCTQSNTHLRNGHQKQRVNNKNKAWRVKIK